MKVLAQPTAGRGGPADADELVNLEIHLDVHREDQGKIARVMAKLEKFNIWIMESSSVEWSGTGDVQCVLDSTSAITDPLHRSAELLKILSLPGVNYVVFNRRSTKKDSATPTIFVAYDFRSPNLARLIDEALAEVITVTGHCEKDSLAWREYVTEQIRDADGVLGVMPNRATTPSLNLLWEYRIAQRAGIPSQWIVSESVDLAWRPSASNVTVFDEKEPSLALRKATTDLLHTIKARGFGQ